MAIKVNARAVKQDTADASVFGYNTVYQSAAPAIAGALSQAATSISQASAKLKARQESNDRIAADANYGAYRDGLTQATAQLNDAYASEDKDKIAEAEVNFNRYDATQPNFSLGVFGDKEVTDPNAYARYVTDAKTLWTQTQVAERHRKEHYRNANTVKSEIRSVEDLVFQVTNNYTGKPIPMGELKTVLDRINQSYINDAFNNLSSDKAQTAAYGELNDKLEFLLESAVRGAGLDAERVQAIKKMFIDYRQEGAFESFGRSEEVLEFADKNLAEVTKANREAYIKSLEVLVENQASAFFNGINQESLTGEEHINAQTFLDNVSKIDIGLFEEGSKHYKELASAREAAAFFIPVSGADISPFHSSVMQAVKTGEVTIPKEYEAVFARTRDFTNIRDRVRRAADYIKKGLAVSDTSVLDNFGFKTPLQKREFLDKNGYTFTPIVNQSKIEFNMEDPERLLAYATDMIQLNPSGQGALLQHAHNLKTTGKTENEVLQGFFLEQIAMSGGSALDETVSLYSKFYTLGDPNASAIPESTKDYIDVNDAVEAITDDSEINRLIEQARATGNSTLMDVLTRIRRGMIRDVAAQEFKEGLIFRPQKDKQYLRAYYDREDKLVTNNLGIARENKNGHQVRIPQQFIDMLDLEAKYPYTFWNTPRKFISNSLPYRHVSMRVNSMLNNGIYSILPQMFTERYVEALADEMVDTYDFAFKGDRLLDALTAMGGEFQELADDFKADRVGKEDLAEGLLDAKVTTKGNTIIPYLDFSSFGIVSDGSGEMGVAVKAYNSNTFTYEPVIGKNGAQVVIPISSIQRRFDVEGVILGAAPSEQQEAGMREFVRNTPSGL